MRGKIEILNEMFGSKRLVDFTPSEYADPAGTKKGLKSGTVDHYHALVKTIFNKIIFWRRFDRYNPANAVKLKREENVHLRFLNKEEIAQLEKHLPASIYPYFIGALHTGMRRRELCSLIWENISLPIRDIFVPKSKSGKARHIPISDTLTNYCCSFMEMARNPMILFLGHFLHTTFLHKFVKVCKEANIKNVRWHDLRHTFANQLVMAGVNIYTVSK